MRALFSSGPQFLRPRQGILARHFLTASPSRSAPAAALKLDEPERFADV
jgi:hypothetical protein